MRNSLSENIVIKKVPNKMRTFQCNPTSEVIAPRGSRGEKNQITSRETLTMKNCTNILLFFNNKTFLLLKISY